jgi:phosphocarrier protein HPr
MSAAIEKIVHVINESGLHFRPADLIVRAANRFQCQIEIAKDGQSVDCRSIMGILTLGAAQGVQLRLRATGSDAEQAVECLSELFASGFNETDSAVGSPDGSN